MIYPKLFELKKREITLKRDTKAFNYKYATLDQIQDSLRETLEELNLLILHSTVDNNVVTTVMDIEDGTMVQSSIAIGSIETTKVSVDRSGAQIKEVTSQDPQAVGSIITYYRRYNLLQLLDLKTEDDDGASASPRAKAKTAEPKPLESFLNEIKEAGSKEKAVEIAKIAVAIYPAKKAEL